MDKSEERGKAYDSDDVMCPELQGCPWCGEGAYVYRPFSGEVPEKWTISHESEYWDCFAAGKKHGFRSRQQAINSWNARTPAVTSENAKTPERRLPKELPQDNTQGRG